MLAPLLGCNIFLYAVGKEDNTDFIVVLYGRESEGCGNLGCHIALHLVGCSEVQRAADVDEQHHGEFSFFLENLHKGVMETCRNVPFYIADIVAVLVFAHLRESHTTPLEG